MSTTPNMNLTLPVVGTTPEEEWAEILNEALEDVDAHSHVAGEGVPITPAAININDDLQLNSFSLTEVESVLLNDRTTDITSRGLYAKDGNLFYYNTDGDAVQITNGDTIAGTSGSITGLSSPAGAAFSSLTDAFSWTYDSSKHAKFAHSDMQLFPYDGSAAYTKSVTIKAPTTLEAASSYSWTLPADLPASTEYLSISSAGVLNHASLSGTTNQVNVTAGATAITLALPQDIHTGASPTFAGVTTSAAILGATTVTSLVGSTAAFTGQVAGGSLTTGDGAIKLKVFTGSLAASADATLSVSGTIVGVIGYSTNNSSVSGVWTPMMSARLPGATASDMIDFRMNVSATGDVLIRNYDNDSTNAYRVTVFYQ